MSSLSHFDHDGSAHMVDVGGKPDSKRIARAHGRIEMQAETLKLIQAGSHKKGDVLAVARIAGIMAAKKTADLIPLCHPLALSHVSIQFEYYDGQPGIRCEATVETTGPTGVEIEALTAVQISLLTIYDMCKSVNKGMCIQDIKLIHKSGGHSGNWDHPDNVTLA